MKQIGRLFSIVVMVVVVIGVSVPPPTSASSLGLGTVVVAQSLSDQSPPTNQIIIKYRSGAEAQASRIQPGQMKILSDKAGIALTFVREMSGDANVLSLPEKLPVQQVRAISEILMELPEVEYAEPDERAFPALTPNDSLYINQWDLFGAQGINAQPAWDITTGLSSIVVADIDTGIRNHVDLSGRTVPGYDFVIDTPSGNDGQNNGVNDRDNDASDPGDWITQAEHDSGYFMGCPVTNSSWHGTHTAGTIGAIGNNSAGIAGINWNSKILPVRVLGKCGGFTSDIADGMRWAAGLAVSGVPSNPYPAKVLNLSLWGSGACGTTYQNAINDITSAGAVAVIIAGNSNTDASGYRPGNCTGVITVAATGTTGSKASYSSFGSTVEISAPGDSILSTLNTGTTVPAADSYVYYQGTSMAAPHVTGVVSLMFSIDPTLTPAQVLSILQSTARAFPGGSTCNTSICGSGILDAGAALAKSDPFADVPVAGKEWMEPWIAAFYRHGVTTGCGGGNLLPREQRDAGRDGRLPAARQARRGLRTAAGQSLLLGCASCRQGVDGALDRPVLSGRHDHRLRRRQLLPGEQRDARRDGRVRAACPPRGRLCTAPGFGVLLGCTGGGKGMDGALDHPVPQRGHHHGLRRRQLLPGEQCDPRGDGGLHRQGVPLLSISGST